jgi:hypothetical protein
MGGQSRLLVGILGHGQLLDQALSQQVLTPELKALLAGLQPRQRFQQFCCFLISLEEYSGHMKHL